jgi:enoyl-CoA hydratase/carnithine racemase
MSSELLTDRQGDVLVLTMSDPATRNALSEPLVVAGTAAVEAAAADAELRCIVLQGAGGHFCAGGHLAGLTARRAIGPSAQGRMLDLLHRWIETLRACPKPVIAAVEGAAAGAGFSIALACDLIVAAHEARFMLSHAKLGLSPDGGATWALARALPAARLQRIVWLAEPLTAPELHAVGLVTEVCATGDALTRALDLARQLARMAPNALASGKALVRQAADQPLSAQLAAEREHFIRTLFDSNAAEGLQAFMEKRPPRFR